MNLDMNICVRYSVDIAYQHLATLLEAIHEYICMSIYISYIIDIACSYSATLL